MNITRMSRSEIENLIDNLEGMLDELDDTEYQVNFSIRSFINAYDDLITDYHINVLNNLKDHISSTFNDIIVTSEEYIKDLKDEADFRRGLYTKKEDI